MDEQLPLRAAGPGLGLLGATLGVAIQGTQGAVLWGIVAYFVGKSIESLALTITDGTTH